MSRNTYEITGFSDGAIVDFDVLIYAVGYEARSRYVASRFAEHADNLIAYVFSESQELSFEENLSYALKLGAVTLSDHEILTETVRKIDFGRRGSTRDLRILVDVSSMSRTVLSSILAQLLDDDFYEGAEIAIVYAVAEFSEPASFEFEFLHFDPMDDFSGWTASPELPMAMVIGLGYEADHAVGAVEYLDPSATFCFFPKGNDERFAEAVQKANEPLLSQVKPSRIVRYPVSDPLHTLSLLSSIIQSLLETARLVLVPMGPKIFVALCLVSQRIYGDEVSVWRASGHSKDALKDVDAEGPLTGFWIRRASL